ncbi:rhodanese-like domain-containing protein [Lacisediminihabitans sp.]|jgi:rhodanese-related sulfurtransferase|uniref:rhodanese-like domain-containing protein n=1 Tax=Lacisediminihabitans sp. TaxID=2787631 RepID=UPI002F939756
MKQFSEVSAVEAIALTAGGAMLLDVREQDAWDRGHSPLAKLVPMSMLPEGLEDVPTDQRVLVVCHAGSRSLRVTNALLDAGYEAVNVVGGMLAWTAAGGEIVADGADAPRVD